MFYAPACAECVAAQAKLRGAAKEAVRDLEWHEVNILDDLDRAVELGVMTLPSIAVDGELVFTSMPTATQLRTALVERNKGSR